MEIQMRIIRIKIRIIIVKITILFNKTSQLFQFLNIGVKAKEKNKKMLFMLRTVMGSQTTFNNKRTEMAIEARYSMIKI